ncbi:MAG TPA: gluconate 2-dehydrogenase subunit 3 family protein [Bryobacteraceae bacterium]|jgi:glucoside 3-dehydrogenase (cytochrome c) hitch-hiker subunit|nr:gluconate 2-dehydrogenase subunit 3 family protein [Bryobacteraceae bacterium]
MKRRDLFRATSAAAAAGALQLPMVAQNPPAKDAAAGWTPQVFDSHQNETVIALTELIIPKTDTPGAKEALVNRHLDKLLADGVDEQRAAFLDGLNWLDGFSLSKHQKPFVSCSPTEQTALLQTLSDGTDADLAPGRQFFRLAKSWTANIYYKTAIGFQEMNKGGRVPKSYGCTHPEHA